MTPQSQPAASVARPSRVFIFALLWVLAFVLLSGASLAYNCRLDGPPALFSDLFPLGVGSLIAGLYGLIRHL